MYTDDTIAGVWGAPDYGGELPAQLRSVTGIAAVAANGFTFVLLHRNGTLPGAWAGTCDDT